ncbi:hypothetical protein J7E91_18905 [Streptomyces sp. ISL-99]|uniref:hypothetical protein n=1 Tax=Streptomyces sp. ISL-99 TaxID=2819193 RepID=UPI001BE88125|nr:hypothetical protein [Streptomyces sp. ISL-99]MBT2527436.1 hypothetical protein [Streptomyces sp. ISL-99]
MRNTKAFKSAVTDTLAELARLGITVRPGTVADVIEHNVTAVATQLGIKIPSAWRYFDAKALAETLAKQRQEFEQGDEGKIGQAPMPPVDNPELALILAGVPDSLEESGGDLYQVITNVAVNAWMAGHIHGEDGCNGCKDSRGPSGHDWAHRMNAITSMQPDISKWFDRDIWTAALNDTGYSVTRR